MRKPVDTSRPVCHSADAQRPAAADHAPLVLSLLALAYQINPPASAGLNAT